MGQLASVSKTGAQSLRPSTRSEARPYSYSSTFGSDEFPLHSDFAHYRQPPRYILLRCAESGGNVGTTVLDARPVIEAVGALALRRALVVPRRKVQGRRSILRLLESDAASRLFRWDRLFLEPASAAGASAFKQVDAILCAAGPTVVVLERGEMLLIDNWNSVHGRTLVPHDARERHVERVFLDTLHDSSASSRKH